VGSRTSAHPRLHGGGHPAVVRRGRGKPRPWHTAKMPRPPVRMINTDILTSFYLALVLKVTFFPRTRAYITCITMPMGHGRLRRSASRPPVVLARMVHPV